VNLSLSQLINALAPVSPSVVRPTASDAGVDPVFTAFTADSRAVVPGSLFIATRGTTHDASAFIPDALLRGAAGILTDAPADAPEPNALRIHVTDTALALALVSAHAYDHPDRAVKVLATTGTNGKTTTSFLLQQLLTGAGEKTGLLSTVRVDNGRELLPTLFTTPPAPEFHRLLAEMREAGCGHAAVEASSHGLHQRRIAALRVAVAGFTNLSRDHLDYHGTMDAYADAKAILFQELADAAAICVDDATGRRFADDFATTGRPLLRISTSTARTAAADLWIEAPTLGLGGVQATLVARGRDGTGLRRALATRLVGAHNLQNAVLAVAMASLAGLDLDTAIAQLADAPGAPGRLERVTAERGGPTVFVDYAHTPDALAQVLMTLRETLRETAPGAELVCVFGAGGDRDRGKRPEMGAAAVAGADRVVVTSDNPRSEDPSAIIGDILAGTGGATSGRVVALVDRREAIRAAIATASADDVILIAGKGHEDYQIIGQTRLPFDDRRVAAEALAAWRPGPAQANGGAA
jgi:UDP-N-acetylmuramoyl-L-alanyl-D-glutamate--2,6-diaminopimelate ligase